jgi:hypothetical protein
MEIVGWITIILLCALALTFIVIELGPVIHSEVSSWKMRKQKSLESKEDKALFKKEMRELKRQAKKIKYMEKHNLPTEEESWSEESYDNGDEEKQDVYYEVDNTDVSEEELVDSVANDIVVEDEVVKTNEN